MCSREKKSHVHYDILFNDLKRNNRELYGFKRVTCVGARESCKLCRIIIGSFTGMFRRP